MLFSFLCTYQLESVIQFWGSVQLCQLCSKSYYDSRFYGLHCIDTLWAERRYLTAISNLVHVLCSTFHAVFTGKLVHCMTELHTVPCIQSLWVLYIPSSFVLPLHAVLVHVHILYCLSLGCYAGCKKYIPSMAYWHICLALLWCLQLTKTWLLPLSIATVEQEETRGKNASDVTHLY